MKTIPVCSLLSGMILPALCFAQASSPEQTEKSDGKAAKREGMRPFIEAWKRADTDQNGKISKAEFDAMPRLQNLAAEKRDKLFARLDKNSDSELQRDELAQMMKPFDHKMGGPPHLVGLDADKSGGISFEEFQRSEFFSKIPAEKQKTVFARLDTDGDGQITPKDRPEPKFRGEHGEGHPPRPDQDGPEKIERINRKLDLDGDGALSFEEFRAGPAVKNLTEDEQEDRFEVLDQNHDLKISKEDFPPPPPRE